MEDSYSDFERKLLAFASARDWSQFHSPKNLACSLSIEAAEVLENFQWMSEADSNNLSSIKIQEVESELADVFCYLIYLANRIGVDLVEAGNKKLKLNEIRYPVEKSKGKSTKYTDL